MAQAPLLTVIFYGKIWHLSGGRGNQRSAPRQFSHLGNNSWPFIEHLSSDQQLVKKARTKQINTSPKVRYSVMPLCCSIQYCVVADTRSVPILEGPQDASYSLVLGMSDVERQEYEYEQ
jgi:hypothetical protein